MRRTKSIIAIGLFLVLFTVVFALDGTHTASAQTGTTAVALIAGENHTCMLTDVGGVNCWGSNDRGQLGTNTLTTKLDPIGLFAVETGAVEITSGANHNCAMFDGGTVRCWGANESGQLGDGSTIDRSAPVDVAGLPSGVVSVSAGGSTTCVVTNVDRAWCWGSNSSGQLGDGTTTDRTDPAELTSITRDVVAISPGMTHTCAISIEGAAFCWGANDAGQIGDGSTTDRTAPREVFGLFKGVKHIAVGPDFTCAINQTSGVECWGANGNGQLGDNSVTGHIQADDVFGLTGGFAEVTAGETNVCALTELGAVWCWGGNSEGQLGMGDTIARTRPFSPEVLSQRTTLLTTGSRHGCSLTEQVNLAPELRCWGSNSSGQLGTGDTVSSDEPILIIGDVFTQAEPTPTPVPPTATPVPPTPTRVPATATSVPQSTATAAAVAPTVTATTIRPTQTTASAERTPESQSTSTPTQSDEESSGGSCNSTGSANGASIGILAMLALPFSLLFFRRITRAVARRE